MFEPIHIPADAVMLFNKVKLKEGVSMEDVELTIGEMCNVVKNTYGNDSGGFIAGQVFKYAGFVSDEGSLGEHGPEEDHIVIVTYWKSFALHEKSHADNAFKEKFDALVEFARESKELGYEIEWQGTPE
ncbi:MAG: hypothetical protein ABUK01_09850 [Leptospirales bacterium]